MHFTFVKHQTEATSASCDDFNRRQTLWFCWLLHEAGKAVMHRRNMAAALLGRKQRRSRLRIVGSEESILQKSHGIRPRPCVYIRNTPSAWKSGTRTLTSVPVDPPWPPPVGSQVFLPINDTHGRKRGNRLTRCCCLWRDVAVFHDGSV